MRITTFFNLYSFIKSPREIGGSINGWRFNAICNNDHYDGDIGNTCFSASVAFKDNKEDER